MSFDIKAFERAGRTNSPIGERADQAYPCPDQPAGAVGAAILSSGAMAVGKEVGLSIHEVRELAEACNRLVLADGEDPTGMNGSQTLCAVGMFWGVLHMLRLQQEGES
jgi:hypothetical protein